MKRNTLSMIAFFPALGAGVAGLGCTDSNASGSPAAINTKADSPDSQESSRARIVPIDETYEGHTYGEWQAKFWQWRTPMPKEHHPLEGTADCSERQTGDVWFLGYPAGEGESTVTRECKMPHGTALFVALNVTECSTAPDDTYNLLDPDHPFPVTKQGLMDCVAQHKQLTQAPTEIDGRPVENAVGYYARTPWWGYPIGTDDIPNLWDIPEGIYGALAEGAAILVKPLSRGEHTIHFASRDVPGYLRDVTYKITVQ